MTTLVAHPGPTYQHEGEQMVKRLTWKKADRALTALAELIDCDNVASSDKTRLNDAANRVRELRDRCAPPAERWERSRS